MSAPTAPAFYEGDRVEPLRWSQGPRTVVGLLPNDRLLLSCGLDIKAEDVRLLPARPL